MAKHLGERLNDDLLEKLNRAELFRGGGLALTVLTLDERGWPHVAMAPGAVAVKPDEVWLILGGQTGSLKNVERDSRMTLLVAAPETLYYIKGRAEIARREMSLIPQEAALRLKVTEVLADMEPFVKITGGITYRYQPTHDDYTMVLVALLDELHGLAEASN